MPAPCGAMSSFLCSCFWSPLPKIPEEYLRPQGLYSLERVDLKKLKRLIRNQQLAPCHPGLEECGPGQDLEECPICFLQYPILNSSLCCQKRVCTECFLQVQTSTPPHQFSACPFCKVTRPTGYLVKLVGARTAEEKEQERMEEQKVIEARIREREEELCRDQERALQRQQQQQQQAAAAVAAASGHRAPNSTTGTQISHNVGLQQPCAGVMAAAAAGVASTLDSLGGAAAAVAALTAGSTATSWGSAGGASGEPEQAVLGVHGNGGIHCHGNPFSGRHHRASAAGIVAAGNASNGARIVVGSYPTASSRRAVAAGCMSPVSHPHNYPVQQHPGGRYLVAAEAGGGSVNAEAPENGGQVALYGGGGHQRRHPSGGSGRRYRLTDYVPAGVVDIALGLDDINDLMLEQAMYESLAPATSSQAAQPATDGGGLSSVVQGGCNLAVFVPDDNDPALAAALVGSLSGGGGGDGAVESHDTTTPQCMMSPAGPMGRSGRRGAGSGGCQQPFSESLGYPASGSRSPTQVTSPSPPSGNGARGGAGGWGAFGSPQIRKAAAVTAAAVGMGGRRSLLPQQQPVPQLEVAQGLTNVARPHRTFGGPGVLAGVEEQEDKSEEVAGLASRRTGGWALLAATPKAVIDAAISSLMEDGRAESSVYPFVPGVGSQLGGSAQPALLRTSDAVAVEEVDVSLGHRLAIEAEAHGHHLDGRAPLLLMDGGAAATQQQQDALAGTTNRDAVCGSSTSVGDLTPATLSSIPSDVAGVLAGAASELSSVAGGAIVPCDPVILDCVGVSEQHMTNPLYDVWSNSSSATSFRHGGVDAPTNSMPAPGVTVVATTRAQEDGIQVADSATVNSISRWGFKYGSDRSSFGSNGRSAPTQVLRVDEQELDRGAAAAEGAVVPVYASRTARSAGTAADGGMSVVPALEQVVSCRRAPPPPLAVARSASSHSNSGASASAVVAWSSAATAQLTPSSSEMPTPSPRLGLPHMEALVSLTVPATAAGGRGHDSPVVDCTAKTEVEIEPLVLVASTTTVVTIQTLAAELLRHGSDAAAATAAVMSVGSGDIPTTPISSHVVALGMVLLAPPSGSSGGGSLPQPLTRPAVVENPDGSLQVLVPIGAVAEKQRRRAATIGNTAVADDTMALPYADYDIPELEALPPLSLLPVGISNGTLNESGSAAITALEPQLEEAARDGDLIRHCENMDELLVRRMEANDAAVAAVIAAADQAGRSES